MVNEDDRKEMRRGIGDAVMYGQTFLQMKNYSTPDVIVELIAALLSLAAFLSKSNANLDRDEFELACSVAANEQWDITERRRSQ